MEQLTVAVPYPRTDGGYQWGPVCPVHPTYRNGNQPTDRKRESAENFAAASACTHPDHKEAANAIPLRSVSAPSGGTWMPLEQAVRECVNLDYVRDGIGPMARGIVYRSGYWGAVNTIHNVFVDVLPAGRDGGGNYLPRRAVGWEVAEQDATDNGRVRRHLTSWWYDDGNRVLHLLTEE